MISTAAATQALAKSITSRAKESTSRWPTAVMFRRVPHMVYITVIRRTTLPDEQNEPTSLLLPTKIKTSVLFVIDFYRKPIRPGSNARHREKYICSEYVLESHLSRNTYVFRAGAHEINTQHSRRTTLALRKSEGCTEWLLHLIVKLPRQEPPQPGEVQCPLQFRLIFNLILYKIATTSAYHFLTISMFFRSLEGFRLRNPGDHQPTR